ncbi:hypothetical protein [Lysinibacillus cavernae]|nr:hypothetical protein [Lysinibacillus cavernae]
MSITAVTISRLQGQLDLTVEELIQMEVRLLRDHIGGIKILYGNH